MVEFESPAELKQALEYASLDEIRERMPQNVEEKKSKYHSMVESVDWQTHKFLADSWTAAFFWHLMGSPILQQSLHYGFSKARV